jgi:hypothetical protein
LRKDPAESGAGLNDSVLAAFSVEDKELSSPIVYRIDGQSYNFFNRLPYLA